MTTRDDISIPSRRAVLDQVMRHRQTGGIACAEIARATGMSPSSVYWALRKMRYLGLVDANGTGVGTKWFPVDEAVSARRARELTRAQRLLNKAKAEARRRTRKAFDDFARPSIHRVVPAAGAKPIRVRAPASVFHLGESVR